MPNIKIKRLKSIIFIVLPITFVIAFEILLILSVGQTVTIIGWLVFLLQLLTYLINLQWGLPVIFEKKLYLQFTIKFFTIVCGYILLRAMVVLKEPWTARFWELVVSREQLLFAFIHLFLVLGTSFFVGFFRRSQINAIKNEAALKAELESLAMIKRMENIVRQIQLNPHLFFNTLNAIKQETQDLLPHVSRSAELLAKIQQYYLIDPVANEKIKLEIELEVVMCYCELELYLRGKKTFVNLNIEIEENVFEIPHGVLITLIENVYCYGYINDPEYPAMIEIKLVNNKLYLHTWNIKRDSVFSGHGLGQKNVKAILDHQYNGLYSFETSETEEFYDLQFQIDL